MERGVFVSVGFALGVALVSVSIGMALTESVWRWAIAGAITLTVCAAVSQALESSESKAT